MSPGRRRGRSDLRPLLRYDFTPAGRQPGLRFPPWQRRDPTGSSRRLTRQAGGSAIPSCDRTRSGLRVLLVRYARGKARGHPLRSAPGHVHPLERLGDGRHDPLGAQCRGLPRDARRWIAPSLVRYRRDPDAVASDCPQAVKATALDDLREGAVPPACGASATTRLEGEPAHPRGRQAGGNGEPLDGHPARPPPAGAHRIPDRHRPGINFFLAELSPPGTVTIGEEQVHLRAHDRECKTSSGVVRRPRRGGRIDRDRPRPVQRAPERRRAADCDPPEYRPAARGRSADLGARRVLAAGRFTSQKGFDLLIDAWARVAPAD